jgi:UPF0755 protein
MLVAMLQPPVVFPIDTVYTIESGSGLNFVASDLASKNIIKSTFLFKIFSVIQGGTKAILAGDYVLDSKESVYSLSKRMTSADYHLQQVKITIPEGYNIYEIAKIVSEKLPKINENNFIADTKNLEGYLFPDTYMFEINVKSESLIKSMQDNFNEKIKGLDKQIILFKKSQSDIIKMASIVEEEARTTETRKIIAGILWKRFDLGMPLQVDSSFKYINGKGTKDLTLADLKIDSPYNSYLYKGLPPTPIANPGLDSITATITPTKTDYLYFLNDKEGVMHYAKTFNEHLQNKKLYLE